MIWISSMEILGSSINVLTFFGLMYMIVSKDLTMPKFGSPECVANAIVDGGVTSVV